MILSMTGYANVSRDADYGTLSLELRSVNHRYLDVQLRLPENLRALEGQLRELVAAKLSRGKIDCRLTHTPQAAQQRTPSLNREALRRLLDLAQSVHAEAPSSPPLSVADILRWPGIFGEEPEPMEAMTADTVALFHQAIAELGATRAREGAKLEQVLHERIARIEALSGQIAPHVPKIVQAYAEKLSAKLAEAGAQPEADRLHQEVVLFASKIDIDEELSRLQAHLSEVRRILQQGGAVGKRLDFLMQELNRESNTIGAKSATYEVSHLSVELKILIEQMREQIQNIE